MRTAEPKERQQSRWCPASESLIWWLLAAAFLIRLAALVDMGVAYDGDFPDAIGYLESARALLSTGTMSFYEVAPSALVMPGFVVFLSALIALAPTSFTEFLVAKIALLVLSSASVYLLFLIGRRIGGASVGLISAAMLAFSLPHIYAGTLTLTENPFLFLLLALTLATIRLADNPGWQRFAICAVCFCLAVYVRQAAIGFLLPAFVYLLVRRYPWDLLVKQVVSLVAITVIVLAPWWARNYQAFGEFVPFTTLGGAPFFEGTFQRFDPYDNEAFEVMDEVLEGFDGTEAERGRILAQVGRDRLAQRWTEDPGDVLIAYGVRKPAAAWLLPFYWDAVFGISGYWVLRIHALISVIGVPLLGFLSMRAKAPHEFWLLFLNVVIITLGAAYYLGLSRYVFPFAPYLYVGIAYAVASWVRPLLPAR